jgi:hypothetical protein
MNAFDPFRQACHFLTALALRYSNRIALGYNDADRADTLLKGVTGKRLQYK